MTKTTARPAQLAPVRIGKGVKVHLGHLSSIKGPNGEPRYCSYCPASAGRDGAPFTAGEAITEEIDCRSCQRQASAEALQRAADAAQAARTVEQIEADGANPRSAAQQAQMERWLASHDGASIPQALAADEVDAYAADGFMTASPPVAIQSIDVTGAICMDTKVHTRHRIIGSFRGSCSGITGAKTQGTAEIPAALPNLQYDHNDQCIGCGAVRLPTVVGSPDGADYWCTATCGFKTGTVSPAMILRAAANRLERFPRGLGADLRAALDAAAVALIRTEHTRGAGEDLDVEDLVESARDALGAYFDEVTGPDAIPGAELVDEYGVLVPRRMLAETLYLAAARNDGATFHEIAREQLLGEAVHLLLDCRPNSHTVLLSWGPFSALWEMELLATVSLDETYQRQDFTGPAADAFAKAQDLIRRALKISEPPYLKAAHYDDSYVTHEFAIEDTTYGRTNWR